MKSRGEHYIIFETILIAFACAIAFPSAFQKKDVSTLIAIAISTALAVPISNIGIYIGTYYNKPEYYDKKINIKKYKLFQVQARSIEGIANEHQRDVSWLIWSVIQFASSELSSITDTNKEKQLKSLWLLYIFNWKPGCKSKRLSIIIWYCSLLISPFSDYSTPVISNMKIYIKVISNVNLMLRKCFLKVV